MLGAALKQKVLLGGAPDKKLLRAALDKKLRWELH